MDDMVSGSVFPVDGGRAAVLAREGCKRRAPSK